MYQSEAPPLKTIATNLPSEDIDEDGDWIATLAETAEQEKLRADKLAALGVNLDE
jgi:hypothetical protein